MELPSFSFIMAYLSSFRFSYTLCEQGEKGSGEHAFHRAVKAFRKKDWEKAFRLCASSIDLPWQSQEVKAEALNMRGTFLFLIGDADGARRDYELAIEADASLANTYIKMAAVVMEKDNEPKDADAWFDKAMALNANDPDVFYHRYIHQFIIY